MESNHYLMRWLMNGDCDDRMFSLIAFEIYESMEKANCSLNNSTYELMIPNLAKSRCCFQTLSRNKRKKFQARHGEGVACLLQMHAVSGKIDYAMRLYNSMTNVEAMGYVVDVMANDVLVLYIKEGSADLVLRCLHFMDQNRTNNVIIR
ncbi:Pentatricopeptide repeat-containing protein, mitochondrial, partial [Mucuna pruriens]